MEAVTSDQPTSPSGNSLVRHNVSHLSRIYPAGWRTDSSNYSPVEMWNGGCQIGTGWRGWEQVQVRVSGPRARGQEPLGTQAGPDTARAGSGAGPLNSGTRNGTLGWFAGPVRVAGIGVIPDPASASPCDAKASGYPEEAGL